jgi:hypothetical protein
MTLKNDPSAPDMCYVQFDKSEKIAASVMYPHATSEHYGCVDKMALSEGTSDVPSKSNKVYILDYPNALFGISIDFTACVPVISQFQNNSKVDPGLLAVFSPVVTDTIIKLIGDSDSSRNNPIFYLFRSAAIA